MSNLETIILLVRMYDKHIWYNLHNVTKDSLSCNLFMYVFTLAV